MQQLLGICKKGCRQFDFSLNDIPSHDVRLRSRYTLFFDEEMEIMNALLEQNVQIRRKSEFSLKFVLPTSKSRKMSLLNVF